MGLSYKVNELPTTLREGEFAVLNGTVYTGNSNNEPVPVGGGSEPIPVLSALPDTDASKAGQKFFLNGTVWVYNYETNGVKRFEGLDIGVPWPVKGYKELSIKLTGGGANPISFEDIVNDIGQEFQDFEKNTTGVYGAYPLGFAWNFDVFGLYTAEINISNFALVNPVIGSVVIGEDIISIRTQLLSTGDSVDYFFSESTHDSFSLKIYPPTA